MFAYCIHVISCLVINSCQSHYKHTLDTKRKGLDFVQWTISVDELNHTIDNLIRRSMDVLPMNRHQKRKTTSS